MIKQVMRKVRKDSIKQVAPYVIVVALTVSSFIMVSWYMNMISPSGFMKTEAIEIKDYEFSQALTALNITVRNVGTTKPTVIEAKVNGTKVDIADVTVDFGKTQTLTISYDWIPKATYDIILVTAKGNEFNCTVATS